jgi:hypothetical protein
MTVVSPSLSRGLVGPPTREGSAGSLSWRRRERQRERVMNDCVWGRSQVGSMLSPTYKKKRKKTNSPRRQKCATPTAHRWRVPRRPGHTPVGFVEREACLFVREAGNGCRRGGERHTARRSAFSLLTVQMRSPAAWSSTKSAPPQSGQVRANLRRVESCIFIFVSGAGGARRRGARRRRGGQQCRPAPARRRTLV